MSNNYFEGWYLKHQENGATLSLIPGRSTDKAFIQIIDDHSSYYVTYPLKDYYYMDNEIQIADNFFSIKGISVNIDRENLSLVGSLAYHNVVPVSYDIMGPFRFLPLECKHSVFSMTHQVEGTLVFNRRPIEFKNAKGYIEGDRGRSFPSSYTWTHANDFDDNCSIMISVAKIPFAGFNFWGCISFVWYKGQKFRLATYKGVRIINRSPNRLEIKQGKHRLIAELPKQNGHALFAPNRGAMERIIHEVPSCVARYRFYEGSNLIFDKTCTHASYEFVDRDSNA